MLSNQSFFHGNIRKYTIAFGNLFDDISVNRNDRLRKVPLSYETQSQFIVRIRQKSSITEEGTKVRMTLPRLSFNLEGLSYDSGRMTSKFAQIVQKDAEGNLQKQYKFVPYNLTFSVSAISDSMNDILQIAEQVLPFFTPSYTLHVKDNPLLPNEYSDTQVYLESVNILADTNGEFSGDKRYYLLEMTFKLEGQIYGPLYDNAHLIKKATINFEEILNDGRSSSPFKIFEAEIDPNEADPDDPHEIVERWITPDYS